MKKRGGRRDADLAIRLRRTFSSIFPFFPSLPTTPTPPSSSSLKINACDSDSNTHLTWAAHLHLSYHIRSRHVALLLLYLTLIPIFSYCLREAKGGSGLSHHISGTGRRLFVIKVRYFAVQVGSCYLADTISHCCFTFISWGGGGCGAQTRILMLCTNFCVPHG